MTSRVLTRVLLAALVGSVCGLAITCTVVLLADGGPDGSHGDRRAAGAAVSAGADAVSAPSDPREVLRHWDAERAAAWTSGDTAALGSLYTPGSVAGRHDVAMLRAWNAREQRVTTMTTQVLALRVQVDRERRLVLRVTDRLVGVEAGAVSLPRDGVSTRTVELCRVGDGPWRVVAVSEPGRRPARSR